MNRDYLIQYLAVFMAVIILLMKRKGIKKYAAVAVFSIVCANIFCYIANYLKLWIYPVRVIDATFVPIPFNFIILPILIMFWMKHNPINTAYRIAYAFVSSIALIIIEVILSTYTNVFKFQNNYYVYISFVLWMLSFYIFYKFYIWTTDNIYLK